MTPILFLLVLFAIFISYKIYESFYFKSENFKIIKNNIAEFISGCNELNEHIDELKSSYSDIKRIDFGYSDLSDDSVYKMRRRRWAEEDKSHRTYNCSSIVCKNASAQPFKYLCKYFNIQSNEEFLEKFEKVLNDFSAAEQGKVLLRTQRDLIVSSIANSIPSIIYKFSLKKLIKELGFYDIDLSDLYFPVYTFQYVSAGGNSSSKCDIKLDVKNLDSFVIYLGELVKFRKSIAGQRALMSCALREKIKIRDNFSCKICGLSTEQEENLLLEIDHIIPLSKGGVTSEHNLQILCWKCNRSKGAKII